MRSTSPEAARTARESIALGAWVRLSPWSPADRASPAVRIPLATPRSARAPEAERTANAEGSEQPEPGLAEDGDATPPARRIPAPDAAPDPAEAAALNDEGFALIQSGRPEEAVPVLSAPSPCSARAPTTSTTPSRSSTSARRCGAGRPAEAVPVLGNGLRSPTRPAPCGRARRRARRPRVGAEVEAAEAGEDPVEAGEETGLGGLGARRQRDRPLLGDARLELARALELGVQLGAQQQRQVRDPQPDQEDDDPGDAAVGGVVGGEVGDVEGEARRRGQPERRAPAPRPA